MNVPSTYLIAVEKMVKGLHVRLNAEGREFWHKGEVPTRSDVWNVILSVNCDDSVNLCSQGHFIRSNVPFSHIAWSVFDKS